MRQQREAQLVEASTLFQPTHDRDVTTNKGNPVNVVWVYLCKTAIYLMDQWFLVWSKLISDN